MLSHFDHRFSTYRGATQAQLNVGSLPRLTDREHDDPDIEAARPLLGRPHRSHCQTAGQMGPRLAARLARHHPVPATNAPSSHRCCRRSRSATCFRLRSQQSPPTATCLHARLVEPGLRLRCAPEAERNEYDLHHPQAARVPHARNVRATRRLATRTQSSPTGYAPTSSNSPTPRGD